MGLVAAAAAVLTECLRTPESQAAAVEAVKEARAVADAADEAAAGSGAAGSAARGWVAKGLEVPEGKEPEGWVVEDWVVGAVAAASG